MRQGWFKLTSTAALLLALYFATVPAARADGQQQTTFLTTSSPTGVGVRLIGGGVNYHKITWNVSGGTFATCTIQADSSVNNISYNSGDVVAGTSCVANGASSISTGVFNYVRVHRTVFTVATGTPVLTVLYTAYINNPNPSSSFDCSGTVNMEMLFNDAGSCAGDLALTYDKTTAFLYLTSATLHPGIEIYDQTTFNDIGFFTNGGAYIDTFDGTTALSLLARAGAALALNSNNHAVWLITGDFALGNLAVAGSSGQVFMSQGSGVVPHWADIPAVAAPGSTSELIFNDGGVFGAFSELTRGPLDHSLNLAGVFNVTSQVNVGSVGGVVITSVGNVSALDMQAEITTLSESLRTTNHITFDAFDSNDSVYRTFMMLTSANTPSLTIAAPAGGTLTVSSDKYSTTTNCTDSGGTCGSAAAGAVTIAAGATSVTVATTAVTASSRISITENSGLGGALGVTCNTTFARVYPVTAINPGTSFVISSSAAPAVNPACLTYSIVN